MSPNVLQAISVAPQILVGQRLSGAGEDVLYTVSDGSTAILKTGVLCNVTNDVALAPGGGMTAKVSISIIPSGGPDDGTGRIIDLFQLNAGDSLTLTDYFRNVQLDSGSSIRAQSDTAGAVDAVISGVVVVDTYVPPAPIAPPVIS